MSYTLIRAFGKIDIKRRVGRDYMSEEVYEYGRLIKRENRFIAKVEINGAIERVHVPNTGRLPQILLEGVRAFFYARFNIILELV